MFRKSLLLLFVLVNGYCFGQNLSIEEIRSQLDQAQTNEKIAQQIYTTLSQNESKDPLLLSLAASSNAVMCIHRKSPSKRLSLIKQANRLLNKAVQEDPDHIEVRLIRLSIQTKIPKFLGQSKQVKEDKKFVLQHLHSIDKYGIPTASKASYYTILEESNRFSPSELKKAKQYLLQ